MDYYNLLELSKEPFSNTPDPTLFYASRQHIQCLQKLEIAIRLQRGLNVVTGDVGTGKTVLCRRLIRNLTDAQMVAHLILDPAFDTPLIFLQTILALLGEKDLPPANNEHVLKETIKQTLFKAGVTEKKTICLIIDEGQKLPIACLELLREFLNYETNEQKLLQIVIFAQTEFNVTLAQMANFTDRINSFVALRPMGLSDTAAMIRFRLQRTSKCSPPQVRFTLPAVFLIHLISGGYPRKIMHICHQSLLALIIQNRIKITFAVVRACAARPYYARKYRLKMAMIFGGICLTGFLMIGMHGFSMAPLRAELFSISSPAASSKTAAVEKGIPPSPVEIPSIRQDTPSIPALGNSPGRMETPAPSPPLLIPPKTLGTLTVCANDTLGLLIKMVHGRYAPNMLTRILADNPDIDSAGRITIGQRIRFPAIPLEVNPAPVPHPTWLCIAKFRTLAESVDYLRRHRAQEDFLRIISFLTDDAELHHSIVVKSSDWSLSHAEKALQDLPSPLKTNATLIHDWKNAVFFFTDPYFRMPKPMLFAKGTLRTEKDF